MSHYELEKMRINDRCNPIICGEWKKQRSDGTIYSGAKLIDMFVDVFINRMAEISILERLNITRQIYKELGRI